MEDTFRSHIEAFLADLMAGYTATAVGRKVIHDPIWGSVAFEPWEVRVIDSPLLQRLGEINQVGLARSAYPAALHTRFEHSLGTTAIASRMMERLKQDAQGRFGDLIDDEQIRLVRMAALLHDVGHCIYSHLSEAIYSSFDSFRAAQRDVLKALGQTIRPKPHEIFSYYIVTSDFLASFFAEQIGYPGIKTPEQAKRLLSDAAKIIVGATLDPKNGVGRSYLTRVINGTFDADKLDYTQRDSYTAGIALAYGAEHFLLKLCLCRVKEGDTEDYRLSLYEDGLPVVEELLFNRSLLYYYIYNHQKVLAAEAQMRDALYSLVDAGFITHPCDFLSLNSHTFGVATASETPVFQTLGAKRGRTVSSLFAAFSRRDYMKRAYELNPAKYDTEALEREWLEALGEKIVEAKPQQRAELLRRGIAEFGRSTLYDAPTKRLIDRLNGISMEKSVALRRELADRIRVRLREEGKPDEIDAFDLAICIPSPQKGSVSLTLADKKGNPVDEAYAVARTERWTVPLNLGKWRGFFFVSSSVDRTVAREVFLEWLQEQ